MGPAIRSSVFLALGVVMVMGMGMGMVACTSEPKPAAAVDVEPKEPEPIPELDAALAETFTEALRHAEPGTLAKMASAGIAEVEGPRLAPFLRAALEAYASAPPDMKANMVAKELDSWAGRSAWNRACAGGIAVLEEQAIVDPGARGRLLWEKCELGRFSALSEDKVRVAEPMASMLAMLLLDHLTRQGSLSEDEVFWITCLTDAPAPSTIAVDTLDDPPPT